jgi:hypothetical protein
MAIAFANTRDRWAGANLGPVLAIVVALTSLAAGICPVRTARRARVSSAYELIPAQISMVRPGVPIVPPKKQAAAPASPQGTLTPQEQKRLNDIMSQMTPKQRKQLAKTVKRMTPEQRQQFVAALKRQLAAATANRAR